MVEIKNSKLSVAINSFGAELQSVKSADGYEYLWQGDPEVWSGRAPVLFPIVGGLLDDEFIYDGKAYSLEKHGFARLLDFETESAEEKKAVFLLTSNDETRVGYPFEFEFRVIFTLKDNKLEVEYRVDNTDTKTIYFSFGAHEAYSCPGGLEGVVVEFDKEAPRYRYHVTGNFMNGEKEAVETVENKLYIKDEFFEKDALIFPDVKSKKVRVYKEGIDKSVTVEYDGFKNLLVWTKPNAQYLCIEPWDGMPDALGYSKKIEEKGDIIALDSGKTYSLIHTITFE